MEGGFLSSTTRDAFRFVKAVVFGGASGKKKRGDECR